MSDKIDNDYTRWWANVPLEGMPLWRKCFRLIELYWWNLACWPKWARLFILIAFPVAYPLWLFVGWLFITVTVAVSIAESLINTVKTLLK